MVQACSQRLKTLLRQGNLRCVQRLKCDHLLIVHVMTKINYSMTCINIILCLIK